MPRNAPSDSKKARRKRKTLNTKQRDPRQLQRAQQNGNADAAVRGMDLYLQLPRGAIIVAWLGTIRDPISRGKVLPHVSATYHA